MNMEKFAFVILHYNTIEDTEACVKSIHNNCRNNDYHIYIVDNASPNESGKLIREKYASDKKVSSILSNENLGFAKGNNLGITEAIKDGYSDFIVVLNSDTKIRQRDFCEKIIKSYNSNHFAVLGPTIYTPIGCTTINPGRLYVLQGRELDFLKNYYSKGLKYLKNENFLKLKILTKAMGLNARIKNFRKRKFQYTENCVLHGCCLIFSKDYFGKFSGFDPRTFLYFEEEILYAHVIHSGLKTVYDPSIEIWHKEDGATDSVLGTGTKKMFFLYENILKSMQVYRSVLKEKNI